MPPKVASGMIQTLSDAKKYFRLDNGYGGERCFRERRERTMERHQPARRTRRNFLWTSLALPMVLRPASGDRPKAMAQTRMLPPTPSCAEKDAATPSQMEGPYYKRNSPQRTSLLEPGITGMTIVITGSVLSRDCQPIARALVDFWQAD